MIDVCTTLMLRLLMVTHHVPVVAMRILPYGYSRGHGGRVVTLSPPTFEAGVRFPARPRVGKLVVACR